MTFPISLTEKAAKQVLAVMEEQGLKDNFLRIAIRGGGCSGFQYVLDFTKETTDFDMEAEQYGLKVVVDQISASHLEGTTIDYVNDLMQQGFKFDNPKAARHCGCGQSFS